MGSNPAENDPASRGCRDPGCHRSGLAENVRICHDSGMEQEVTLLPAFAALASLIRQHGESPVDGPCGPPPTLAELRVRSGELNDLVREFGGSNVRVVGSVARGSARPESDLDLLVHLESEDLICLGRIQEALEGLLDCRVDVISDHDLEVQQDDPLGREARLSARLSTDAVSL